MNNDVRMWLKMDTIAHVVGQSQSGWHWTICKIWTPNGDLTTERPARICDACLARLQEVRVND